MTLESHVERQPQTVESYKSLIPEQGESSNLLSQQNQTDKRLKADALLGPISFFDSGKADLSLNASVQQNIVEIPLGAISRFAGKLPVDQQDKHPVKVEDPRKLHEQHKHKMPGSAEVKMPAGSSDRIEVRMPSGTVQVSKESLQSNMLDHVADNAFNKLEQLVRRNSIGLRTTQAVESAAAQNNIKYEVESYVNTSILSGANRSKVALAFNTNDDRGALFDKDGNHIVLRAEVGKDGKFRLNFGGDD